MRRRDAAIAALIVAAATALAFLPPLRSLAGPSLDTLFWLRESVFPPRHLAAESPAIVVAIDEESYRTPPFRDKPQALWTPEIAQVLRALLASEARIIGLDVIFPTSLEPLLPGYDREFLLALREASRQNRVLLAKVQHAELPISPFPSQSLVVGNDRNIRASNLVQDPDEVVRRVPLLIEAEDASAGTRHEPAFALELAARAAGVAVSPTEAGIRFGDRLLPDSADNTMLIDFAGGNSIPTYSLADLQACAVAGKADYFAKHFANKVVLIGPVLDLEDRKLTSKRWINRPPPQSTADRCALPAHPELVRQDVDRPDLPGIYVHAAAINSLLRGEVLRRLPAAVSLLFTAAATGTAVLLLLLLPIGWGAAAAAASLLPIVALATLLLRLEWVVPLLPTLAATVLGGGAMLGYRVAVADRDRRWLQRIFGLYLAPAVVDRLAAKDEMPALGGERRDMTFLFSDVADFTTLSERTDPAKLAEAINAYLDGVCEAVMAHGGMVTDFAGDGVFAMFGAPLTLPDHIERAIAAARDIAAFTERFRGEQAKKGMEFGRTRVGLHSGSALVGNFGGRKRLKYAALGDAVNTASRVEGLNKYFGTGTAASETVAAGEEERFRPLGEFILKGKTTPLRIYELLTPARASSGFIARYRAAYAALAAGEPGALAQFEALAAEEPQDGPTSVHLTRLRAGQGSPLIRMDEK